MTNEITHTSNHTKPSERRILVVANEIVEGIALHHAIGPATNGEPSVQVRVIAPALNSRLRHWLSDEDEARQQARFRLTASLEHLRAAGIDADGRVADPDPLLAITDELYEFGADEIVIVLHPERRSRRLRRDLVARARRRFAQPVIRVVAEPSEDSVLTADRTHESTTPQGTTSASSGRPQGANARPRPRENWASG